MSVLCIVQARLGSTRFPGKVLEPLGGTTVLGQVLDRLQRARTLEAIVVATTTSPRDEALVAYCERRATPVFRGSEDDVLARYHGAATRFGGDPIVRVTSDCPFVDPATLDRVVAAHRESGVDYTGNDLVRTYPLGLSVEVFAMAALVQAHGEAVQPDEREHVTPFIRARPYRFGLRNVSAPPELSRPHYRITVDTPEDYTLVARLCELAGGDPLVPSRRIVAWLDAHPELAAINAHVPQKTVHLR
jgi:spore coat polysaccharide biosynthesis protein SpsF